MQRPDFCVLIQLRVFILMQPSMQGNLQEGVAGYALQIVSSALPNGTSINRNSQRHSAVQEGSYDSFLRSLFEALLTKL
jgi:hypothetical protein